MEFQFRLSIIVIINIIIITKPGASCSCTESLHHKDVRLPTADILKPGRDGDLGKDVKRDTLGIRVVMKLHGA